MHIHRSSPLALLKSLWNNRHLITALAKRDVAGRYKETGFGLFWSLINPLILLAVYTLVFGLIFKGHWQSNHSSTMEYSLSIYCGIIIFTMFSECVSRAPNIILTNKNYVKKVIFPLETLPLIALLSALFHCAISFIVWFIFNLFVNGLPPLSSLLLPLIILPLALIVLGVSWLLSALSVYIRDIRQIIGSVITMLMFLSGVFYSADMIPENFKLLFLANPLANIIDLARNALLHGIPPKPAELLLLTLISSLFSWLGFYTFQKLRKGFADVL